MSKTEMVIPQTLRTTLLYTVMTVMATLTKKPTTTTTMMMVVIYRMSLVMGNERNTLG